jgi:hypothetical protein
VCGGALVGYGWRLRKVIEADGSVKRLLIRRLKCCGCGKHHHELPDILVPYKRHCAATIENIINGEDETVCCEESTIRRIRRWWQTLYLYFKGICDALAAKHGVRFGNPLQPREAVRAAANAHLWPSTRSACLSG